MAGPDYRYTARGLADRGGSRRQEAFGSVVVDLDASGGVLGVENWSGPVTIENLLAVLSHCSWVE